MGRVGLADDPVLEKVGIPMRRIVAASWMVLVVLSTTTMAAQSLSGAEWSTEVEKIRGLLEGGKWKPALKRVEKLADEIEANAWDRPGIERLLATVGRYRAVAEINLGMDHEALWHWHSAWNLAPPTDLASMGSLGRAGVLIEHRLRALGRMPEPYSAPTDLERIQIEPAVLPQVERPILANDSASRSARLPDLLIEVVITRRGHMLHPVVDDTGVPAVAVWATLEWLLTYPPSRPATRDGNPVDVLQLLTIELGRDRQRGFVDLGPGGR